MAQIAVTINNKSYSIACDDGQEEHLTSLANYLQERVSELANSMGQIGDSRLLVMAGLLVADELAEVYAENEKLKAERDKLSTRTPPPGVEEADAAAIDAITERINSIADKLERA